MKSIHMLIHTLNKGERRVTRTALTCFSGKKDAVTKTLRLFDYILKSKNHLPTNAECASYIYNDPKDKRFKMLKLRFRQKLMDSIVLDVNMGRKELLDEVDQANAKVRKKIAQLYHLYFSKGNQPILKNLLDEIISISKKYECYSPLIEAIRFKKLSEGYLKGEKFFNKLNEEIAFYERCNHSVHKATDHYYRFLIRANFSARIHKAKKHIYLKESITELKKDYQLTHSGVVGYFLKWFETYYFENSEDYPSAIESSKQLLFIVKDNKSVYRKSRLCVIYQNLCQFNIFLGQNKEAIKNAKLAQELVLDLSAHYLNSLELEFYGLFYENRLQEAEALIILLIDKAEKSERDDFRYAKYRFCHAAVLFKKEDYKPVFKELNKDLEISKDKEGWGTAIRILTIMALIEMDRLDEVSSRLDSLRKHIERNTERDNPPEREKLILRVLKILENSGFTLSNYEEKKIEGYIKQLASNDKLYKWKPLDPELIPFHKWFVKKYAEKKKKLKE